MTGSNVLRRVLGLVRRGLWVVVLVGAVLAVAWSRLWAPVRKTS